jgi:hypothetical protein
MKCVWERFYCFISVMNVRKIPNSTWLSMTFGREINNYHYYYYNIISIIIIINNNITPSLGSKIFRVLRLYGFERKRSWPDLVTIAVLA